MDNDSRTNTDRSGLLIAGTPPPPLPPRPATAMPAPPSATTPRYVPPPPKPRRSGSRKVLIAAVLACVAVGVVVVYLGFGRLMQVATEMVDTTVPHTADVGECYQTGSATMSPVSCSQAHHFEVISVHFYSLDAARPGAFERLGGAGICDAAFLEWTGIDWLDTDRSAMIAVPTEDAWARGERRAVCALHRDDFEAMFSTQRAG